MKHPGEFDMSRLLLSLAIAVSVSISMFSVQVTSQQLPASKKVGRMQIVKGPALESATDKRKQVMRPNFLERLHL